MKGVMSRNVEKNHACQSIDYFLCLMIDIAIAKINTNKINKINVLLDWSLSASERGFVRHSN